MTYTFHPQSPEDTPEMNRLKARQFGLCVDWSELLKECKDLKKLVDAGKHQYRPELARARAKEESVKSELRQLREKMKAERDSKARGGEHVA